MIDGLDYNNRLTLHSTIKIVEIKNKTNAKLFNKLKVGDELDISVPLLQGHTVTKCYAVNVIVNFCRQEDSRTMTITQFNNVMRNFKFKQEI